MNLNIPATRPNLQPSRPVSPRVVTELASRSLIIPEQCQVMYGEHDVQNLAISIRPKDVGTYTENNSVVAFVDSDGDLRVAPRTETLMELLEEGGFRNGGLYVPLSNGEVPAAPLMNAKWFVLKYEAISERKAERERDLTKRYLMQSSMRGITDPTLSQWVNCDGAEYVQSFSNESERARRISTYDDYNERFQLVGTFSSNNGTLAFISSKGSLFVGPNTEERTKILTDCHFKRGGFFVPFSNGEVAIDPVIKARLMIAFAE